MGQTKNILIERKMQNFRFFKECVIKKKRIKIYLKKDLKKRNFKKGSKNPKNQGFRSCFFKDRVLFVKAET